MHRILATIMLFAIGVLPLATQVSVQDALDIYWIDVEGGAATLVVTPAGQAILMDAGWGTTDDRDARRIQAALSHANAARIDVFIASHFHPDHVGGVPALARLVPIDRFIDHGDSVEQDRDRSRQAWEGYLTAAAGTRQSVRPGDTLPIRELEISFVSSNGEVLTAPLEPQGANPYCPGALVRDDDPFENGRSVGYLLSLGAFELLNLGDLSWNLEHALACPENKLGTVDVFQITHHGGEASAAPQLMWALAPTVAIVNNGPRKGGHPSVLDTVRHSPGLQGLWQLHRSTEGGDANTNDALIANHEEDEGACEGHWLRAVVHPEGRTFTIVNGRTGFSRTYRSR